MHTDRILFIVTSATKLANASTPTGSWIEEIAAPYYAFTDARCEITFASPLGGAAPIDPVSRQEENCTASTRRFDVDAAARSALAATKKLSSLNAKDYDAVFFAGGHGTMADFPSDATVISIVEHFYAAGKPLASVCHGPACLVGAKKPNGEPLVKGHRFTCFTDAEETSVGLADVVPFLLESQLRAQGGKPVNELPFQGNVVTDGNLITGQNTQSSIATAEHVIHQLRCTQQRRAA